MMPPAFVLTGELSARYGLLSYFLIYFALAFGWRSLVVLLAHGREPVRPVVRR